MARSNPSARTRPLDGAALDRLALHYAGRYATTRARLRDYLRRKVRASGWSGEQPPAIDLLVERMAALGYVDDRAFAEARGAALGRRGYGVRRVTQALRAAGVGEDDAAPACGRAIDGALDAALAFARRRRLGPFAAERADREGERRALAALVRAGHSFAIARRVAAAAPGDEIIADEVALDT